MKDGKKTEKEFDNSFNRGIDDDGSDRLMTSSQVWLEVREVMSQDVVTISSDATLDSAAKIMSEDNISCVVVLSGDEMSGILTETDFLRRVVGRGESLDNKKVSEIMSSPVVSVYPEFSVFEAGRLMEEKRVKRLPVIKDGRLVGIVTQTDLIRILTYYGMWRDVSEIMSRGLISVQKKQTVSEAAEIMAFSGISCIVVREGDEAVGILTERDLIKRVITKKKDPARIRTEEVMSSPVIHVPPDYSLFSAGKVMEKMNVRRLIIKEGDRLYGIVTQTDIFRALKRKLEEQERKNFTLFDKSKSCVFMVDLNGNTSYVNPVFVKLLDVSDAGELLGKPFLPRQFWFNPKDRSRFLKKLKKEGGVEIKELALKTRKDRRVYVTLFSTATKNFRGEISGKQGILYDITAKKELVALREAEEALRESEQTFRAIFDNASDGIVLADAETKKFHTANKMFCKMLGYSLEDIKNLGVADIHPETDLPYVIDEFEKQLRGEITLAEDIPVKKKDDSVFYVDVNSTPITLNGKTYLMGAFRDVTGRKHSEEEQTRLQQELFQAQKMESIGLLAGGIAHDFNNLLQGIMGYVQLMKVRVDENDVNYSELNLIEVVAEKAADLTRQLLSYARKGKYIVEAVKIENVVEQVILLLRRTIDRRIVINTEIPAGIPNIKADASQIHQLLLNLCINAKDAMPEGGALTLFAEERLIDERFCRSRSDAEPGEYVCLNVRDTGIGMDKETRDRIFEPFFTTKEVGKGTGLGLSMVYGIVKNHGGFIDVKSAPGRGTVFQIFLPVISEEESVSEETAPKTITSSIDKQVGDEEKGKRILVVDDEEIVRYLAIDLLTSLGYETVPAVDGQDAVEVFKKEKANINLVLLDLVMPRLGGVETFKKLRKIDQDVPIVLLSGYAKDEAAQELLDEGASGFIQKPYKLEELAGIVQSV